MYFGELFSKINKIQLEKNTWNGKVVFVKSGDNGCEQAEQIFRDILTPMVVPSSRDVVEAQYP